MSSESEVALRSDEDRFVLDLKWNDMVGPTGDIGDRAGGGPGTHKTGNSAQSTARL